MEDSTSTSDISLIDKVSKPVKRQIKTKINNIDLPKNYLMQAIETILESHVKLVGRKLKISNTYNNPNVATKVNTLCSDRSHLLIYCNKSSDKRKLENSLKPIFDELRLCLLACDWDNYKELLLILFRSSNVKDVYIMFSIRSCFILLLNHPNRTPEMLDNFMASCLSINEKSRRLEYLKNCFSLKGTSSSTLNRNLSKDDEEEEEDDEEIFFNSSYSSD